jgi:hypothetical protein
MRYAATLSIALILTLLLDYWSLRVAVSSLKAIRREEFEELAKRIDWQVFFGFK